MSEAGELVLSREERLALAQHSPEWQQMATLWATAKAIAEPTNGICPDALRGKPGAIFQQLLMGRDLGLPPSQALLQLYTVHNRVGLTAQLMRAMIYRAGHSLTYVERTDERCVLRGKRKDGAELEVTWDLTRAAEVDADEKGMKLTEKANWRNHPRAMLDARATAELARALFPDVLVWASYLPDELGAEVAEVEDNG
jgi:hypothetical protein